MDACPPTWVPCTPRHGHLRPTPAHLGGWVPCLPTWVLCQPTWVPCQPTWVLRPPPTHLGPMAPKWVLLGHGRGSLLWPRPHWLGRGLLHAGIHRLRLHLYTGRGRGRGRVFKAKSLQITWVKHPFLNINTKNNALRAYTHPCGD